MEPGNFTLYSWISFGDKEDNRKQIEWKPLKIRGGKVVFFREPLLDQFNCFQSICKDKEYWKIVFFDKTQFRTELTVTIMNVEPYDEDDKKSLENSLARAICQNCNDIPPTDKLFIASGFLRNSKALKISDYDEINGRWIAVDGRGISMFIKKNEDYIFFRTILLLALACAYRKVMEDLVDKLSKADDNAMLNGKLAREVGEFNAKCYFHHPVKLKNVLLPDIWEKIAKRFRIPEINIELKEQTQELYYIISEENQKKAERRWNRISLILGLISSLQVLSLIPEETRISFFGETYSFLKDIILITLQQIVG